MDSRTTASVYLAFANHDKKKKGVQHLKSLYDSLAPILRISEKDKSISLLREDKEGAPFAYELLQGGLPLPGLTLIHLEADSPQDGEWFLNAAGGKRLVVDWDILFLDHLKTLKLIYVDKGASLDIVEKLLFAGAPAVLGTRFEDQSRDSEIFRSKFYAELSTGKTLQASFEAAAAVVDRECILKKIPSDPYEYWESKENETDTTFKWGLYCHSNNASILDWTMVDPDRIQAASPIIPPPPPLEKPVAENIKEGVLDVSVNPVSQPIEELAEQKVGTGLVETQIKDEQVEDEFEEAHVPEFKSAPEPEITEDNEESLPALEVQESESTTIDEPLVYGSDSIEDTSKEIEPEVSPEPSPTTIHSEPEVREQLAKAPREEKFIETIEKAADRVGSWEVEDQIQYIPLKQIRIRETQLMYEQTEAYLQEFPQADPLPSEEAVVALSIIEKEEPPVEVKKEEPVYPDATETNPEPEQERVTESPKEIHQPAQIESRFEEKPIIKEPLNREPAKRTSTDPNIVPIHKEKNTGYEPSPNPAYQGYTSPAAPLQNSSRKANTSIKPYVNKAEVLIAKPKKKRISIKPIINSKPLIFTGIGLVLLVFVLAGVFIFSGMDANDIWTSQEDNYLAAFGDGDTYNILLLPFHDYENCMTEDAVDEESVREQMHLFQEENELGIKVKFIGDQACPKNSEDARRIGQVYNADMVVWGNYTEIKQDTQKLHTRYISLRNNNNFLGSQSKNLGKLALGDSYDLQEGYIAGSAEDITNWLLGIVTLREERYQPALQLFKRLKLEDTHESANLYHLMAKCYQGLEQYDQVLQSYNKVIFLSPDNANAYHNRGLLYQDLKQEDQAIADFSEAIRLNPRHIKALYNRNLLKEGEVDDFYVDPELMQTNEEVWDTDEEENTDTFLQDEIQLVTDTDRSGRGPADTNLEPGMLRDAGEQIEDLYESESFKNMTSAETHFSDGISLEQRGRLSDAVEAYRHAIEAAPRESNYYHARAKVYEKIGKLKDALNDYTTASQLAPRNTEIYLNRAYLYERMHKYYEAVADYTKITNLIPNSPGAYLYRGKAYQFVKQPRKSLEDFEKAISLNPNDATGYYFRARLHVELKKPNLAIEDFSRAIEINTGYASAYRERGELYSSRGQFEDAIRDFNKVLSLNPRDANIFARRSEMHHQLGNEEQAVKDMEQAIKLSPGNKRFKNMLAKLES